MRVYLAGKISMNDWRHRAVAGLRGAVESHETSGSCLEWPVLKGSVFGHDYVGPFFVGCDHGCYHGASSHGSGPVGGTGGPAGGCGGLSFRDLVAPLCIRAIDSADLVFAWIDDLTAYGTFLELGYALGRKRRVVLGHVLNSFDQELRDLWFFPTFVADAGGDLLSASDPISALKIALLLRR